MTRQGEHGISWTDETWNPVVGCSHVSEACRFCYAERLDRRQMMPGRKDGFRPWTEPNAEYNVRLHPERLEQPLKWTKPRRVFVNSMGDLFHEQVPEEFIDRVFAVMALCRTVIFQVLTKREERMKEYINGVVQRTKGRYLTPALLEHAGALAEAEGDTALADIFFKGANDHAGESIWPLPNLWLGVSAEDQKTFDERVRFLLATPARVRFVSLEPLLGPIDFSRVAIPMGFVECHGGTLPPLDWVIVGGESGPGARPMHPDWVRSIRDQCVETNVPFFFKQHGEWISKMDAQLYGPPNVWKCPKWGTLDIDANWFSLTTPWNGRQGDDSDTRELIMIRVGKKRAGRVLDGKVWEQFPEVP